MENDTCKLQYKYRSMHYEIEVTYLTQIHIECNVQYCIYNATKYFVSLLYWIYCNLSLFSLDRFLYVRTYIKAIHLYILQFCSVLLILSRHSSTHSVTQESTFPCFPNTLDVSVHVRHEVF